MKEVGDSMRSRRALFRMEETWACFQNEEKEPGERQKLEVRAMGNNCVGRAGKDIMKSTKEQTSLGRPPLSLGSLLQIPIWLYSSQVGGSARESFRRVLLKGGPWTRGIRFTLGAWLLLSGSTRSTASEDHRWCLLKIEKQWFKAVAINMSTEGRYI